MYTQYAYGSCLNHHQLYWEQVGREDSHLKGLTRDCKIN